MPVLRPHRIEAIEQAMLELLLRALGAYEGGLCPMARRACARQGPALDEPTRLRRAAGFLRRRAIALGSPSERYERAEWRTLGL